MLLDHDRTASVREVVPPEVVGVDSVVLPFDELHATRTRRPITTTVARLTDLVCLIPVQVILAHLTSMRGDDMSSVA